MRTVSQAPSQLRALRCRPGLPSVHLKFNAYGDSEHVLLAAAGTGLRARVYVLRGRATFKHALASDQLVNKLSDSSGAHSWVVTGCQPYNVHHLYAYYGFGDM